MEVHDGSTIDSSPAVADGVVYVGSYDGNLYAFGLPSDQMSKDFSPPERPNPSCWLPTFR